jgi:hypothetical protein
VAVAVGVDPDDGVNLALEQGMAVAPSRRRPLAGTGLGWRGLGHSCCRRQPASTQTRHHKQHHSEDYCEREVDELELQGGRVYLHLGARSDDPPRP